MNTLAKWNPFRELDEMQNRFGNFFGGFPNRMGNSNGETLTLPDWSPQVDISEDDQEYLIKADLPEMKKDDVSVVVEDGIVSVSGERKTEKEEKKKVSPHRALYGSFRRGFLVPEDADASKVAAEFKEGVLKVHLPKSATAKPKPVEVKVQ